MRDTWPIWLHISVVRRNSGVKFTPKFPYFWHHSTILMIRWAKREKSDEHEKQSWKSGRARKTNLKVRTSKKNKKIQWAIFDRVTQVELHREWIFHDFPRRLMTVLWLYTSPAILRGALNCGPKVSLPTDVMATRSLASSLGASRGATNLRPRGVS